ncbi:hypothetical protein CBR_g24365 [Chara braunii]|uniref:Uncharacterized protein n=1 Tax=Chara braunii TaxID=69332 RepID=A0A388JMJ6_CHABU|nr:hypothetical protein CBR_g24365 [Chara braunii]|eukprot:GBG59017.1 hypothetical protein CBR_g24365 [Chara braunii]
MEEEESGKGNGAGATWQKDVEMDMAAAMVTGSSMDDDKVEGEREGEGDGEGEVGEGGEGGEEEEEEGKERMRSFVEEADEMKKLISAISRADGAADPAIYKRMENILEKYQEQPQLLDPHLEAITVPTMAALDRRVMNGIAAGDVGDAESVDLSAVKKLCRLMRVLAKVRGYKTVVKFFPNHARQLEPVLALLQRCHKLWRARSELEDGEMETLCTLLLWLSILALIPFDLATVDTALANKLYDNGCGKEVANGEWGVEGKNQPPPLVDRMVAIAKHYLGCQGVMRDMAAVLLSRLLTRPDMKVALKSFVAWAHAIIVAVQGDDPSDPSSVLSVVGVVNAMVHIFKVGGRDILATVAEQCWSDACTLAASPMAQCSSLTMKLLMKLAERISLTYLPPKIPTWRYKRCERSLSRTLGSIGCGEFPHSPAIQSDVAARVEREKADVGWRPPSLKTGGMNGVSGGGLALAGGTIDNGEERGGEDEGNDGNDMDDDANDDEDEDIPEVIEDVIEQLLAGLRNKQGDVRWSAAKGIGRVTGRLPLSLADDVVASVLELFKPTEGDGAWHGGCLALAELARRGLLLPGRLETVVPVVEKALHYDVRRGAHSIGGHVRDAAAYVCWAFVRAYSPDIMLKPLTRLAPVLLTVAVYDREAVRALRVFARTYLLPASANRIELSTAKYLSTLRTDRNPASRRGSALALGELPSELLQPMKEEVIDALCNATVAIEDNPEHCDVESRVNAVSSLIAVCETLGIREEKHVDRNGNGDGDGDGDGEGDGDGDGTVATCEENGGEDSVCGVNGDGVGRRRNSEKKDHDEGHLPVGIVGRRVVDCLLASLDDYAIDKRGDVGSWVRKAAMNALERCAWLLSKFLEKDEKRKGGDAEKEGYREKRVRSEFASDLALRVMGGVMKQAVEKIDSVRDVAGRMLHRLVHTRQLAVLNWPRHRELQAIIPSNQAINWKAASQSFPILVKILAFPEYRPFIVSGLVISVGGLGNSLGQSSSSSLSSFLLDHMTSEDARSLAFVRDFANEFIVLMRTNLHSDRLCRNRGLLDAAPTKVMKMVSTKAR